MTSIFLFFTVEAYKYNYSFGEHFTVMREICLIREGHGVTLEDSFSQEGIIGCLIYTLK